MQPNPIVKNKVVLYSILISLSFHILIFFVLGKMISLKETSFTNQSKPKIILVTLNNSGLDVLENKLSQRNIKNLSKIKHQTPKKIIEEQVIKKKSQVINKNKNITEIGDVALGDIPENVVRQKILKIENTDSSIHQEKNLSNNISNEVITSDLAENKEKIEVIPPDYKINRKPVYPRAARIKGYQGTVYLKIILNSEGKVIESTIEKTSGYSILDRAALKASYKWYFKPAYINSTAVSTTILVPVTFKLVKED